MAVGLAITSVKGSSPVAARIGWTSIFFTFTSGRGSRRRGISRRARGTARCKGEEDRGPDDPCDAAGGHGERGQPGLRHRQKARGDPRHERGGVVAAERRTGDGRDRRDQRRRDPEFHTVSHLANRGSASPTRCTMVHHRPVTRKDDHLILMTHCQTLPYPSWPGPLGSRAPHAGPAPVRDVEGAPRVSEGEPGPRSQTCSNND